VAKAIHRLGRGKGLGEPSLVRSAVVALGRIAPSMRSVGQPDVADAAEELAARLRESSLREEATTSRSAAPAAGDGSSEGGPGGSRWLFAEALAVGASVRSGSGSAATELLALARTGTPGVLVDRVDAQGAPDGSRGIDPAAIAARVAAVLDVAMTEGPEGPVVLPSWTSAWFGQSIEAHGVRTRWGVASYAIRWHGERPAILWEVEPGDGVDPDGPGPVFTAPGLDPQWRGQGWAGEGLLNRLEPPEGIVPTTVVHDHMQSGQRIEDAATIAPSGGSAVDPAAEPAKSAEPAESAEPVAPPVEDEPKSFPGEGISFS
jgi:hypothetical protein